MRITPKKFGLILIKFKEWQQNKNGDYNRQGSHCTGKIVKSNSRQGKHREFEKFGKTRGKHREFENFRMILKSNSHLHSRAAGRDS